MLKLCQPSRAWVLPQHAVSALSAGTWLQGQRAWLAAAAARSGACLYAVLGVQPQASQDAIKQAFRQRAKELHPDMAEGPADPEPFLRLVTAYEVLSSVEQRQLYDAQRDAGLPPFMRDAAAESMRRQQQAGGRTRPSTGAGNGAGGEQGRSGWRQHHWQQQEAWRYGWDEWARAGPAVTTQKDAARRRGVLGALQRYKNTLEAELHDALMLAYLGPRLDIEAGELPPAFEAEERSHPDASRDLLHLVSGRTLLGVVREKQPLHLGDQHTPQQLSHSDDHRQPPLSGAAWHCQQTQRQLEHGQCAVRGVSTQLVQDVAGLSDEELDGLLDKQHALRASYDWVQEKESPSMLLQQLQPPQPSQAVEVSHTSGSSSKVHVHTNRQCSSETLPMGASHARAAWLQRTQASCPQAHDDNGRPTDGEPTASAGHLQPAAADTGSGCSTNSKDATSSRSFNHQHLQGHDTEYAANTTVHTASSAADPADVAPGLAKAFAEGLAEGVREAVQHLAGQQHEHHHQASNSASGAEGSSCSTSSDEGHAHSRAHSTGEKSRPSGSDGRRKRRAKWRRVLDPTPDWRAADWSFTDADEGVTVLEVQLDQQVAAVAVRCDAQHLRPTKIYINNRFTVAVLDDIVMEPHTGELVAAIYRMYTPGVVHAWFYRPQAPQSRLLARLKRCWLPPSGAWLFAPRNNAFNKGGWYVEHEGMRSSHKPGWLHPCVYALAAALDSLDRERRSMNTASAYAKAWQWSGVAGLSRWLHAPPQP